MGDSTNRLERLYFLLLVLPFAGQDGDVQLVGSSKSG